MGLDMYLTKRVYVGAKYKHNNVRGTIKLTSGKENEAIKINKKRVSAIIEEVAYWRKANAIHRWFVENVQEGGDDCKEYYVTEDNIKDLVSECKNAISVIEKSPKKIKVLRDYAGNKYELEVYDVEEVNLPTAEGFFFGGTEYDDYYLDTLKDTINQLEPLLEEEGDYYYQSSW